MWTSLSSHDNLFSDMFKVALQREETWELTQIEFNDQDQTWHLFIDFTRGTTFAYPLYGAATPKKDWRHLDFWDWKTYMHARLPRVKCKACNKVTQVTVKWARALSYFNVLFEAWAMCLVAEMPVNAAAHELREHDSRMWRIFHHYVDKAMAELYQRRNGFRLIIRPQGATPLHYLVRGCGSQNGAICNRRYRHGIPWCNRQVLLSKFC
ncbi:helix-turn-helix domain-containing protein [Paenibacillus popilliae]|uniref:helix-turn-helix domain-containing protein n=1 Tax=Paenibacillus popilliae TaxID=78057 RepID=UPI0006975CED|nr:helix-turn-helix domain-containing protein [Paenibacillus popilliae]